MRRGCWRGGARAAGMPGKLQSGSVCDQLPSGKHGKEKPSDGHYYAKVARQRGGDGVGALNQPCRGDGTAEQGERWGWDTRGLRIRIEGHWQSCGGRAEGVGRLRVGIEGLQQSWGAGLGWQGLCMGSPAPITQLP